MQNTESTTTLNARVVAREARRARLRGLLQQDRGWTLAALGEELGADHRTLRNDLAALGLTIERWEGAGNTPEHLIAERRERLRRLLQDDPTWTLSALVEELGESRSTILRDLGALGLTLRALKAAARPEGEPVPA